MEESGRLNEPRKNELTGRKQVIRMVLGLVNETLSIAGSPLRGNTTELESVSVSRRTSSANVGKESETPHGMESKFGVYIKFNGCIIVLIVGFHVILNAHRWIVQLQNWNEYHFLAGLEMRNHPVVDGVFQIMWIIAVTSLYQALWLEVGLLLYPIGFVLGVESLIIGVGDVIKRWNNEAEDCYMRRGQDAVLFFAVLVYFYYTLYILKQLFRSRDRKSTALPAPGSLQRQSTYPLVRVQ